MAAGEKTIREQLGSDHERVLGVLGEVRALLGDGQIAEATDRWAEFVELLERHLAVEEELLFPLLARLVSGRPVVEDLLGEHDAMRDLAGRAERALIDEDGDGTLELLGRLSVRLVEHAEREDLQLYAAIDALIEESEEAVGGPLSAAGRSLLS